MNNLPKPQNQFKRKISKNDSEYEIIINSYQEPIRKSANVRCHTLIQISKDKEDWGHTYLQNTVNKEESAGIFDMVRKHLDRFKNPY